MDKNKLPKTRKFTPAWWNAEFELQHAVVRGEEQCVLLELLKTRDSL
jgi:hypothetical protein